ncbi:radical SAM/SPASM domain-containing protein [Thermogemmatispora onikobensis]|uniref:radical SAM/SPASM domain-containing protein n=1 Tax=Thermogemmatispora onikobensis TaxID=732234 RepID=UPI000852EB66|nr:radical SAM/SPASM domain-containing protein [Thermogemmatispora onikobensis]
MLPSLFSIFLDYKCNFWCGHCSVGSSPRTVMPMPRELLLKIMTELREVPTAKVVVFTGGEATLRKQLLLEGISLAKAGGYVTRVVSNGGWATTPERARAMVRDLKSAGLDELNTSYDDFHAPFASIECIVNLVRAGLEEGLRIGLGVIVDKNATWDAAAVRRALSEGLGMEIAEIEKRVTILEDYPTPTGSGEQLDVNGLDAGDKLNMGCPEVLKTVSLHPNGMVKACCGHAMFYAQDLTLGNLNEERLIDILTRSQQNLVYWWLHMLGPKRILDKLGVEGTYTSICHACQALLADHRQAMLEYLKAHRDEVLLQDVVLGDSLKRVSTIVLKRKEEILAQMRRLES